MIDKVISLQSPLDCRRFSVVGGNKCARARNMAKLEEKGNSR